MKPIILKILFFTGLLIGLNGCYTIIWTPEMDFPTADNYDMSTIYYGDTYYGPYYYYYDYPWWLDIIPPVATPVGAQGSGVSETNTLRNSGDRGAPTRIPELQPPSRNAPPTNTDITGNSNNSGSSNTETSARNSSSNSGSSVGRESSSGSGNSVRNNNGGRRSGGRK